MMSCSIYPSMDERMKRMWYKYAGEYYSAQRRKGTLSLATAWMKLESIMLNEISQSTTTMWDHFICGDIFLLA